MRLLGDFYTIKKSEIVGDNVEITTLINSSHPIYLSHFPNNPITPGVFIVQMAQEILENHLNMHLTLQEGKTIKFKAPIYPTSIEEIKFIFSIANREENFIKVAISVVNELVLFAKMNLQFKCSQ